MRITPPIAPQTHRISDETGGAATPGFVQLKPSTKNVQPPIYVSTVGGRPSINFEGWRFEAAHQILNAARELGRDTSGSVPSEPPFPAQLMGNHPGTTALQAPKWEPEFLPRYIDAVRDWASKAVPLQKRNQLDDVIRKEVTLLDRKERGGLIQMTSDPRQKQKLETTSIYSIR